MVLASNTGALLFSSIQIPPFPGNLCQLEGRALAEYVLLAWDGSHVSFGRFDAAEPTWEAIVPFDATVAYRLLSHLDKDGRPLVNPQVLRDLIGPDSPLGMELIPNLYRAVRQAARDGSPTTLTKLLFTEWKRLFAQVVGTQSDRLKELLREQGVLHREQYDSDPAAYLFALNTYIALVAKLVAALSLPHGSQDLSAAEVPIKERIEALENGTLFVDAGILNMLAGDFFSWYRNDSSWPHIADAVAGLITRLNSINFDVTRKSAASTRDLFKGIYQSFVPGALRHALGEHYTNDWLAEYAFDAIGWTPKDPLLDPTCGSGTFLLEALRRRLGGLAGPKNASQLLDGLYGIDLNPIAVLAARASLVVFLSPYLDPGQPVRLPVYLADAINPASEENAIYRHRLQTERGIMSFGVPRRLITDDHFFTVFNRIRVLVDSGCAAAVIEKALLTRA